MIRKQRKAQWLYECRAYNHTSGISPDLFGAIEAQQRHEKGLSHFGNAASSIVREVVAPMLAAFGWAPLQPWQEAVLARAMWDGMR